MHFFVLALSTGVEPVFQIEAHPDNSFRSIPQ